MAEDRSLAYALADNIIGFDDGYDTLLERGTKAIRKDPIGVARQLGGSLYDSVKDFAGAFARNPAGAVTDTANELGLSYVEAGQRLSGGIGSYLDQGMSVDEARDAQLMDALTMSELLGGGLFANQLRKGLTPNVDAVSAGPDDPSRRKFMAQAAAAVPVAAVAPDVITDVAKMTGKTGVRAAINPLDMFSQNIKILRRELDEAYDAADEIYENMAGGDLPPSLQDAYDQQIANAEKLHQDLDATTEMEMRELFTDIGPNEIAGAADESLEDLSQALTDFRAYADEEYIEEMIPLAEEIQKRGLLNVKDENGVPQYPYARAVVDDVADHLSGDKTSKDTFGVYNPPAGSQMVRQTPLDIAEKMLAQKIRNLKNDIVLREREMRVDGKSTNEIDDMKAEKRREIFKLQGLPPDMDDFYAQGGAVEGVGSLSRVARDMFRGPRGIATLSRFANGGKAESKQSFNEMMSSLQNDLSEMSSSEFESAYGQSKSEARDTLDMLIVQRYHGPSYEDGIPSAYRTERDAQLAQERMMGEVPPEPSISETTGMVGVDEDGSIVEYGTSYDIAEFAEGGAAIATEDELSNMRTKVMDDYGFDPVSIAIEEGVDPELLLRVMYTENKGRQGPRSEKGAIGLMQLMPLTAEELGVDPYDPEDNTRGGARYLAQMLARFESIPLALAAYNAGPGNVTDYGGIPPFAETQNYVRQIAPALTGADIERQIEDTSEAFVMSQPVAAEGEYSPVPMLRPFNLPTYTGSPGTSPIPQLRPQEPEETPQSIPSVAGVIPGRRTNLFEQYGGIASLTNP